MKFIKIDSSPSTWQPNTAYLIRDNWNDWFYWQTQFSLVYCENATKVTGIGSVKIGQNRMKPESECINDEEKQTFNKPLINNEFNTLDQEFFSLGQSENYYETLNQLPKAVKREILLGLRDVAYNLRIYEDHKLHPAMTNSVMRDISERHIFDALHKLAKGDISSDKYSFAYMFPYKDHQDKSVILDFSIQPNSVPPSNIHAIIGRNGVGKTTLFAGFIKGVINQDAIPEEFAGWLLVSEDGELFRKPDYFTSLTLLSYSPFDKFGPVGVNKIPTGIKYQYIGLMEKSKEDERLIPKSFDTLHNEFCTSMIQCLVGARKERWKTCLQTLENDPLFKEVEISKLADSNILFYDEKWKNEMHKYLNRFSSGHLVTLISITKLVEVTEDRSLTLIDEPEAHLHPPLISAYIRAVSDLMSDRNGVAIVATHSPVVLQEVRSDCAWILNRTRRYIQANRPQIDTFGENVGTLTGEVFNHEVTNTGFYKMVTDAVEKFDDFDALYNYFEEKLGAEGRALARSLLKIKKNEG
ncbi:AAA family ATPase [Rahnella contaminans]|uniref:AAA family ATPase n=1 Tax=Rahnella contaminans TaxID=2703882 RepID=UPI0023DC8D0C|nr:AAA family ATPase [Rahnella contaminans]